MNTNNKFSQTLSDLLKYQIVHDGQNGQDDTKRFKQQVRQRLKPNTSSSFIMSKQNNNQFANYGHQRSQSQKNSIQPQIFLNNEGEELPLANKQNQKQHEKGFNWKTNSPSYNKQRDFSKQLEKRNNTALTTKESLSHYLKPDTIVQSQMSRNSYSQLLNGSQTGSSSANKFNLTYQQMYAGLKTPKSSNISQQKARLSNISQQQMNSNQIKQNQEDIDQNNVIDQYGQENEKNQNQSTLSPINTVQNAFFQNNDDEQNNSAKPKVKYITDSPDWIKQNQNSVETNKTQLTYENDNGPNQENNFKQYKCKYIHIYIAYMRNKYSQSKSQNKQSLSQKALSELISTNGQNLSLFPIQPFDSQHQGSRLSQSSMQNFQIKEIQKQQPSEQADNNRINALKNRISQINSQSNSRQSQVFLQNQHPLFLMQNKNHMSLQNMTNQGDQQSEIKQQQIEMMLLTNKKLTNRLALKKEIQEMNQQKQIQYENYIFEKLQKDLQTHQVNHHYTCVQLIQTLIGTLQGLSEFKNPKIVLKSLEKNFGHLQKPLEFLGFEEISSLKDLSVEPYLIKIAIACSRVEHNEVFFKPNKKLLDGILEITTILEERLAGYQKDHFNSISNSLLEKNQQIQAQQLRLQRYSKSDIVRQRYFYFEYIYNF